jgi:hypothetical protein
MGVRALDREMWRLAIVAMLVLFALGGLAADGMRADQSDYVREQTRPELQVDLTLAPSKTRPDLVELSVDRLMPLDDRTPICLDTLTQVLSTGRADSQHAGQQGYTLDVRSLGAPGRLCIRRALQLADADLHIPALTLPSDTMLYPFDDLQLAHSLAVAGGTPTRLLRVRAVYHLALPGRIFAHGLFWEQPKHASGEVAELHLVRPWSYRLLAPVIVLALFLCALLLLLIQERGTFITASIALTVGTWNARQLLIPLSDVRYTLLDAGLLLVYGVIWVSFLLFAIRLRQSVHSEDRPGV